jgi:hypothetical protein
MRVATDSESGSWFEDIHNMKEVKKVVTYERQSCVPLHGLWQTPVLLRRLHIGTRLLNLKLDFGVSLVYRRSRQSVNEIKQKSDKTSGQAEVELTNAS